MRDLFRRDPDCVIVCEWRSPLQVVAAIRVFNLIVEATVEPMTIHQIGFGVLQYTPTIVEQLGPFGTGIMWKSKEFRCGNCHRLVGTFLVCY